MKLVAPKRWPVIRLTLHADDSFTGGDADFAVTHLGCCGMGAGLKCVLFCSVGWQYFAVSGGGNSGQVRVERRPGWDTPKSKNRPL
jgi:hypothetical protein